MSNSFVHISNVSSNWVTVERPCRKPCWCGDTKLCFIRCFTIQVAIMPSSFLHMITVKLTGLRVPTLPLTGYGSAHPEPGEGHIRGIFLKNLFLKLTPVPFSVVEYTPLASWAFLVSFSLISSFFLPSFYFLFGMSSSRRQPGFTNCAIYSFLDYLNTRLYTQTQNATNVLTFGSKF